jgi:2-phosphoglycolate phosphatase
MNNDASSIRAVLFDFDGTLADSYDAIAASVNHVRAHRGLGPLSVVEVRKHVGRGPSYLLAHTVGVGNPRENDALYRAHHPTVMREGTRLLSGAAEVLAGLKERGLKLAVCSNKPLRYTRELLASLGVGGYLDAVVGPEDVPRPKPAPDMLVLGLKRLGVKAAEALYVGDMTVDVTTARGAGVRVWVVPTGSDTREALEAARPDLLLDALTDVLRLLIPQE